jgi:hypothetical protein
MIASARSGRRGPAVAQNCDQQREDQNEDLRDAEDLDVQLEGARSPGTST